MPLEVSIITPIKATKPHHLVWLNEAIHSIAAQTAVQSCEVVVVDDHSEIDLGPVRGLWDRVRWVEAKGEGVSNARNEAAQAARAPLLLPLDADDKLPPQAIESFLKSWYNHKDKIIYSDVIMFTQDTQRAWIAPEYDFYQLLQHAVILVGSLHKKSDWQKVGGWRADMTKGLEDWEYWITLGEAGVCGFHLNEFLYWYRMNPGGRMARLKSNGQREFQLAKLRMRDLHRDSYNGRYPMGCCGGGTGKSGKPSAKASQKAQLEAVMKDGERVPIRYVGGRSGSFQLTGPSGLTYNVQGADALVTDVNSKPGVLKRDEQFVMGFRGQFERVAPPKPKAKAKVIKQNRSVDVDPEMATDPHADELQYEASVPDPADYSVPALKRLELTPATAYVMLGLERVGKNRKTAIFYLENLSNGQ